MKDLNKQLAAIQKELKAPKNQFNKFANFNYRSCEDILEAVKPLLGDLTLRIEDSIVNVGERYYVQARAILSDGENAVVTTAYAREALTKTGMDEAQITGAASSYARKYALNGLFLIDDTKDADTQDNTQKKTVKKPVAKPAPKQEADPIRDAFRDENGEIARDTKGHTACAVCGKVVSEKVEGYSMDNYGKVLCISHQAAEKAKSAKA